MSLKIICEGLIAMRRPENVIDLKICEHTLQSVNNGHTDVYVRTTFGCVMCGCGWSERTFNRMTYDTYRSLLIVTLTN